MNDRLVFVHYAKNNLKITDGGKQNKTTSFIFYSSNIDCNDKTLKSKRILECSKTTFLRGTNINNLEGQSSTYDQNS